MSPGRDPQTGKFVSGGSGRPSSDFDRYETFSGSLSVQIPAADNAGGQTLEQWSGSDGHVIDFDGELDNDEIFRLQSLEVTVSLALPVTATTEGAAVVGYVIGSDPVDPLPLASRTTALAPLSGATDREVGVLDISQAQSDDDDVMMSGALYAENSALDTVNALAMGGQVANQERSWSPWTEFDKTVDFDESDEIAVTGELTTNNVSDHNVIFTTFVTAHGWVDEWD